MLKKQSGNMRHSIDFNSVSQDMITKLTRSDASQSQIKSNVTLAPPKRKIINPSELTLEFVRGQLCKESVLPSSKSIELSTVQG